MVNIMFKPFPILFTERLTLRQPLLTDGKEIFVLRSDSEINKYLDRQVCKTVGDAKNFIVKVTENINNNESLYWAITLNNKNILVGTICLFSFSTKKNKCEVGYELLTDFQGQGIMQEALKKVIDHAFNMLKIQIIEASCHKDNYRTIQLLEKCSFKNCYKPEKTSNDLLYFRLENSIETS
jgi:ribosomal-protein-alanine N-acetyltransferase